MRVKTWRQLPIVAIAIMALVIMAVLGIVWRASADVPLAARLLAEPYTTTGVRVNFSGLGGNMRGLATDGTTAYVMNTSGNVMTVQLSSIDMTPAQAPQTISGTLHAVGWGSDGAPSLPGNINQLSISYSHGCLFMTNDNNSLGNIKLYCIDVSDWSVTEIDVPDDYPLPIGYYFTQSNMIDFADGRIGKVSAYEKQAGDYYYTSTLRTYTVTGTGKNATIAWSHDYVMKDTDTVYNDSSGWARDEHGIATDGTYLYRIQWNSVSPNTKVWALTGDNTEASVVYGGSYTMPYGNMHYLAHNHTDNYYMMGYFDGASMFITTAADPGPGPGNPFKPTLAASVSKAHGFTTQVTNYDLTYTWSVISSAGAATIDSSGLVTVTGLDLEESATITVTATKSGVPDGSTSGPGTALGEDLNGDDITDADQDNVVVGVNTATGKTVVVSAESDDDCTFDSFSIKQPGDLVKDSSYSYPLGLVDFAASCGDPGFTTTIKQYYYNPPTGDFVARKYVHGTYQTITGATVTRETIGGQEVLVVSYAVTDGGALDDDRTANGVVVDPTGPAVLQPVDTVPGAPNTGIGARVSAVVASATIPLLFIAVCMSIAATLVVADRKYRNKL